MAVWAIADLHLSFGVPDKSMDVFGEQWAQHAEKIAVNWRNSIASDDLVLIAGDISWAMTPEQAKADLDWIADLPGTKVLIRGNHDYWWTSLSKIKKIMPPGIHLIQNNAVHWQGIGVAGARLWDSAEYQFGPYINYRDNPRANKLQTGMEYTQDDSKIFDRELLRLETSLKALHPESRFRIAMTHYPPIGAALAPSLVSQLLEKYRIDICIFGHLHNIKPDLSLFGSNNGVTYYLTSCDYLNFVPLKIA